MMGVRNDRALGRVVRGVLAIGLLALVLPIGEAHAQFTPRGRQPPPQRCIDRIDAAGRARPTVTLADVQLALRRGAISGYGASCLMDWHGRNYSPLMAHFRARGLGERQLAYLSCVHDEARNDASQMNNAFAGLGAHTRCGPNLARELAFEAPRGRPRRGR